MSATAQQIGEAIVQAFQDVPMPEVAALTAGRSLAVPYVRENFGNKSRAELPPRLTSYLGEDLASMSQAGLKYYLPAFMSFLLTEDGKTEDGVLNQTLRALSKIIGLAAAGEFSNALTKTQNVAISRWLNFIVMHISEYYLSVEEEQLLLEIEAKVSPARRE